MDNQKKTYLVGEIAKATGLTVRTLQHYDKIGLLPVTKFTEGGRRLYTDSDLLRLTQIALYKSLGFSLDDIAETLVEALTPDKLAVAFREQYYLLLRQAEKLNTAMSLITASLAVIDKGKYPSWDILQRFIKSLPGNDVFEYVPDMLTNEQKVIFAEAFPTLKEAQDFYHGLIGLMIEAISLKASNIPTSDKRAFDLADRFEKMVSEAVSGNPERLKAFEEIYQSKAMDSTNDSYISDAFTYIDEAVTEKGKR